MPGSGPRFQSVGPFVISLVPCSTIMPISLPNASRMHSCCMLLVARGCSLGLTILFPRSPSSPHPLFPLLPIARARSKSILPASPSYPPCAPSRLSQRFLRIDVIGLFALFRLPLPCNARDGSFTSESKGLGATMLPSLQTA